MSYLSEDDRANPNIIANVLAIEKVCGLITFVASYDDSEYIGFWRGPELCPILSSPLVYFDNEGQFNLCGGQSLSEAILAQAYGDEVFANLRDWMRGVGVNIRWETTNDIVYPEHNSPPDELHQAFYQQFLHF